MSKNSKSIYVKNLQKALQIAKQKKENALFAFDLDSTLICVKYRTQAIIRDCIEQDTFRNKFKKDISNLQTVKVKETDWSIHDILSPMGYNKGGAIDTEILHFWKDKFFSNEYLDVDRPYERAVDFLHLISQTNVNICYLTARNYNKMHEGTLKSLKKWDFPLKNEKHLIMKKEASLSDAEYKVCELEKKATEHSTVVFFENEPVILNLTQKRLPSVHLFWMDSTHSQRETVPTKAYPLSIEYKLS